MITNIGTKAYITKFFYSSLPEIYFQNGDHGKMISAKTISNRKKIPRETTCKIFELVGRGEDGKAVLSETPIAEATVRCNPKDNYSRASGRYYAFSRAIQNPSIASHDTVFLKSFVAGCSSSVDFIIEEHAKHLRGSVRK